MGGAQGNMLGGLLQQLQQPGQMGGQMQIPQQPGRAQALGAPQMGGNGQGKGGGTPQPMTTTPGQSPMSGGQSPYGMTGMGQFGAMPMAYQPPQFQPAIFQPPQLAPAQHMAGRFPTGGLLGGDFNSNNGLTGVDDWRSALTGGTGG